VNPQLTPLLQSIVPLLRELDFGFALVGGLAVSVWTEPRFTRDLDFTISVESDDEAETAARHLITAGYHVAIELDNRRTGRLATLRHVPPGTLLHTDDDRNHHQLYIDLLFDHCGIEQETVRDALECEIAPAVFAPVARLPHLVAMKCLAAANPHRMQDRLDIVAMLRIASSTDIKHAQQFVKLIVQRGYSVDHPIEQLFDELLHLASSDDSDTHFTARQQ